MKVSQLHEYTPEQFSNPSPTPTSTQFQLNFESTSSQPKINLSLNINVNSTSTLTSTQYGCDIKATQSCFVTFYSYRQNFLKTAVMQLQLK